MKRISKLLKIAFMIMFTIILTNNIQVAAKTKNLKYSIMNISQSLQTVDGNKENVIIGCRCKECKEHVDLVEKNKKKEYAVIKPYNKQGEVSTCKNKSDLYNIQVKHYNDKGLLKDESGRKFDYKSIYDEGFKSMQGACLKGGVLYIAFSDKGKTTSAGSDLTAIVQLTMNKTNNKYTVAFVGIVDGLTVRNIYGLGHANDLYYQTNGKIIHSAWYKKGGSADYHFKMGYMSDISKVSYTGNNIEKPSYKVKKIFGVTKGRGKNLSLGLVNKSNKMVICRYKFKNSAYEGYKKLFDTKKKYNIYSTPQCMEYVKKSKKKNDKIYVIRYLENYTKSQEKDINKELKEKSKKKKKKFKEFSYKKANKTLLNNCLVIYSLKGIISQKYIIDEPKGYRQYKWEVESINHIKGKDFCFTIAKPSTLKRALLCNAKIS